jgi:hypothetical protein
MTRPTRRSIQQLDFERRWLTAKITYDGANETEQDDISRQIEDLELAIAATPVADIVDLNIKANCLAEVLHPSSEPIPEDTMEGVLLNAVLVGCRHLADQGNEK